MKFVLALALLFVATLGGNNDLPNPMNDSTCYQLDTSTHNTDGCCVCTSAKIQGGSGSGKADTDITDKDLCLAEAKDTGNAYQFNDGNVADGTGTCVLYTNPGGLINNAAKYTSVRCNVVSCPAPTCEDGVQNGDETGVDCGGTDPECDPCPARRRN